MITSAKSQWPVKALLEFKKITGHPPSETSVALEQGQPIYRRELFMNDHNTAARDLRAIIGLDASFMLELQYHSLQPGQSFGTAALAPAHINAEILENMLSEADGEFEDDV